MPKINQQPKTTKISIFKTDFNRFEIKFTFNKQILDSCREIPGRRFIDNKRWSFPIQQYSNFIKKFKKMPKVEIVKELDQKEQDDIQVVILDESSTELEIAFPKNDELYEITKEVDGVWKEMKFCWAIPVAKKNEFLGKIASKNYNFKIFEKPIYNK